MLTLARPLVFVDLETTGISTKHDRIVQVAVIKLQPDGASREWSTYVNPGVLIPPESTDCHGITDDVVRDAPSFADIAHGFVEGCRDCDLAGYNVKFDLRVLKSELQRIRYPLGVGVLDGLVVDACVLFKMMEPRSLSDAVRRYCGREMVGAHDARVDIRETVEVLRGQLAAYPDLPRTVPELAAILEEGRGGGNRIDPEGKLVWRHREAAFGFGQHETTLLRAAPRGYLKWILKDPGFSEQVKRIAADALEGVFPAWSS